jgi:chemotaxis protein methyltransferase CheR
MPPGPDSLSEKDVNRLCHLIYENSGITVGAHKKTMIEGRLRRRMGALSIGSYGEYCRYVFGAGHAKGEIGYLIDAVSTNKTEFFRERDHFHLLVTRVLPQIAPGPSRELRFWSAGCSTGEEPYTLAITLSEYARSHPGFRYRILATDISSSVLETAKRAEFTRSGLRPVPAALLSRYFMRNKNPRSDLLRVVPELRACVEFRRLNLMEDFSFPDPIDVIFCRNVVIYFDRATQQRLFTKFAHVLSAEGYVFVGHSESLHQMNVPLVAFAPTLYRKAVTSNRREA